MGLESRGVSLGWLDRKEGGRGKGEDKREDMWKLWRWSLCGVCGTVALTNNIFSTHQTKITCFMRVEFVLQAVDEEGCHALLQGTFLTQGSNPSLLHCRQSFYC